MTATELEIRQINTDAGTQARANMDMDTVIEYADAIVANDRTWPFPPITVFFDGAAYWLADGYHRIAAARRVSYPHAIPADVREGSRRDAILYAAGANADHGLKRTVADKQSAVKILLRDAEWGKWSDREIARACKVSHTFVAGIRRGLIGVTAVSGNVATDNAPAQAGGGVGEPEQPEQRTYTTKHGTETTIIYHPVRALQTAVADWLRQTQHGHLRSQVQLIRMMANTGKAHLRWDDMIAVLPTPHRGNDIKQAVNNVADIWRQMVEEQDDGEDMKRRLLDALHSDSSVWENRQNGMTDEEIKLAVGRLWGINVGSSGPGVTAISMTGGSDPAFYYDAYSPYGAKPTLRGAGLLRTVRDLLQIPYPANESGIQAVPNRQVYAAVKQLRDRGHEVIHYGDINKWAVNGTRMTNDEVWVFLDTVLDKEQESTLAALALSDAYLLTAVRPVALALPKLSSRQRHTAADYLKNMSDDEPAEIAALFRSLSALVRDWRND